MRVVILTGSAHLTGVSALLVEEFTEGTGNAGHIDAAFKKVHYCLGCGKACVLTDDMAAMTSC